MQKGKFGKREYIAYGLKKIENRERRNRQGRNKEKVSMTLSLSCEVREYKGRGNAT
jgi:hypothetical protein